jgi:nucleotide-binding universal stress UspA family protein
MSQYRNTHDDYIAAPTLQLPRGGPMTSLQLATPPPAASADTAFSRVLLGVDFSSASLAAARWATAHVAPRTNALLSHVLPFPEHSGEDDDSDRARLESLRQMKPALIGGLGGFAATLDVANWRSILRIGRPSRWLSIIANDEEVSLLVLGRRANANRLRVGEPNVIEGVSRRTNASVLVVPEGIVQPPEHIVAAVDESRFAPRVLHVAQRLARLHEVSMTVLHVLSPVVGAYERVIRTARQLLGGDRQLRSTDHPPARNALPLRMPSWLAELGQSHGIFERDRTEVRMGDPVREITAAASAGTATLVVVGMRGADDAPRGSLGSVARELLARAPLPVLAVNGK